MPKYKDVKPILATLEEFAQSTCDSSYEDGIRIAMQVINEPPAADVQEVNHAYWETREEEVYGIVPTDFKVCSNCGKEYTSVFMAACCADFEEGVIRFHFCPYCGARMDAAEKIKEETNGKV